MNPVRSNYRFGHLSGRTLGFLLTLALLVALVPQTAFAVGGDDAALGEVVLDKVVVSGLEEPVRVRRDAQDVPHIFALNDHDALFMLGYVHAADRFFQMDTLRRTFSGTLAALVGEGALANDVQLRTLGLRRAAEATLASGQIEPETMVWLEAYTDGVNAWLGLGALPPEYGVLEISQAEPWTLIDSLTIGKGLAFGLSFDLDDLDLTQSFLAFQAAGAVAGFDATALFAGDLFRSQPFDTTLSLPDFLADAGIVDLGESTVPNGSTNTTNPEDAKASPAVYVQPIDAPYLSASTGRMITDYLERAQPVTQMAAALAGRDADRGSNWWVAAGERTATGLPMLANDPHLALDTPSTFYEVQIRVADAESPFSVFGVSFPGTPGVIQGCTPWNCWGSTVNPLDVTDVYQESLVIDPTLGVPVATIYQGAPEPLQVIPETYSVNVFDGVLDNSADSGLGPLEGGLTLVVPRRNNGPIVAVDFADPTAPTALSVQYTGWGATSELDFIRKIARARNVEQFRDALQNFDVGSQNWAVASRNGDIAYFTSAEMPLREDLQTLGGPDGGVPPWLVRDGTGTLRHEWLLATEPEEDRALPYQILPYAEMPQAINPEIGYVVNCNNDPVGTTIDNNPLDQIRPGGGLYYLSPGYAQGFRQGRAQGLLDQHLIDVGSFSLGNFVRFQANNQLLDAEVLVPYVLAAFDAATEDGADPTLAALGDDARLAEAIARLRAWDFSTPTGIVEGYDPSDGLGPDLPEPVQTEIESSIAATIWSVTRGQMVQSVIDSTLAELGIEEFAPGSSLSMSALRHLLDDYELTGGTSFSGLDFFRVAEVDDPADERDVVLLSAVVAALDLLASDTFAPAFENSTDQNDYRWGKLHRITFDHPLGAPFSIPPGGGFDDLSAELPGISRAGGFGAVDASSHSARAEGPNEFMFGSGPARRFASIVSTSGPQKPLEVIPGGTSGVLGSPFYADQLRWWLVNEYPVFPWTPAEVVGASRTFQRFEPAGLGSGG